jgi:hypothetical protein
LLVVSTAVAVTAATRIAVPGLLRIAFFAMVFKLRSVPMVFAGMMTTVFVFPMPMMMQR